MKRWALRICVLLILGAIVNVAVAWGCTAQLGRSYSMQPWEISDAEAVAIYHRHVPRTAACSPLPLRIWAEDDRWFGLREVTVNDNVLKFCECPDRPGFVGQWAAGWPAWSLEGQAILAAGGVRRFTLLEAPFVPWLEVRSQFRAGLPYGPIWPGFAINSAFDAALLWLLFAGPFVLRRRRRIRRGLCPKCAYDLRGATGEVCPECGARK